MMGRYLYGVICVCLIIGILLRLTQGSAAQGVVKLLCGAILAITVVSPFQNLDLDRELALLLPGSEEAARAAQAGEDMARKNLSAIIKEDAEAYILDKAAQLQGDLAVDITVSDEALPVPVAARMTGSVSPYARSQLEQVLTGDLGIPKENLRWSG